MGMMHFVMRNRCHPVKQLSAVPPGRKNLITTMRKGVSQHHVCDKDKQSERVRWRNKQDQRQIDRVRHRLTFVKAVEGVMGPVVQTMKTPQNRRIVLRRLVQ
jgi:hypothetical protein